MKNLFNGLYRMTLTCMVLALAGVHPANAQSTAFTYNGRLTGNGALVTGLYDMQFTLFDAINGTVVAGPLAPIVVGVTNGLFTVRIDFGPGIFTGPERWLDVAVRPTGGGAFIPLTPRQEVTSSPYAIRAQAADSGGGSNAWSFTGTNASFNVGNVGIGTTTPATALEVNGVVRSTRSGVPDQYLQLDGGFIADDPFSIRLTSHSTAGAEKNLVIRNLSGEATPGANNSIQFAVGTTASPVTKMTITKDGNVLMTPGGSGGTIQFGTPGFETGMTIIGANRADVRFDGDTLKLLAGSGGGIPASGNGIAIKTSGNVGIGTVNPQSKLHIESAGTVVSTIKSTSDRAVLSLDSTIGGQQRSWTLENGLFGGAGLFGIYDNTASQARLLIKPSTGNVGVGTLDPTAQLQAETSEVKTAVYGNATASGTGVQGRSVAGVGVHAASTSGAAIYADGTAVQSRDKGGFVKAMVYVTYTSSTATVVRCFDGVNNSSTSGCGMLVSRPSVYVDVTFPFQVNDRFISLTAVGGGVDLQNIESSIVEVTVGAGSGSFFLFIY